MQRILDSANNFLYAYVLIILLISGGIYFTIRTRGVQFRLLKDSCRLLFRSNDGPAEGKHVSSFQAFAISLASRVGTGNLAGVALAITIGGPGAVFWMWLTALLGAATGFIEATLAQLYKRRSDGAFVGGPAYYIESGLKSKALACISAILIILTFAFGFSSVQCNTIGAAFENQFGWNHVIVGIVVIAVYAVIILGGVQRIARVTSILVPFMAIGYLILALIVIALNINSVPAAFKLIFDSAFGINQAAGGVVGAAVMQGIRRGLFSNEAGLGSASNAAATAQVSHPVKQGLVQSLGVFIDTLVICTCTALIILLSGVDINGGLTGIALTQQALESQIGASGSLFITAALFLFAFSTIVANYYYGEANLRYFTKSKGAILALRLAVIAIGMLGFCLTLETVWAFTDLFMALCGMLNLATLLVLSPKAFKLLKDYTTQRRKGIKDPVYPDWWEK